MRDPEPEPLRLRNGKDLDSRPGCDIHFAIEYLGTKRCFIFR
jgi:hypothetical protein